MGAEMQVLQLELEVRALRRERDAWRSVALNRDLLDPGGPVFVGQFQTESVERELGGAGLSIDWQRVDIILEEELFGNRVDWPGPGWVAKRWLEGVRAGAVPDYHSSWEGMGQVVAGMVAKGWPWVYIERIGDPQALGWYGFFENEQRDAPDGRWASTAPRMVALAALRALAPQREKEVTTDG